MNTLRVGTRGSRLALWQTRWISNRLRNEHPSIIIEEVIIKTHGDIDGEQRFGAGWPVGGFVGAIEEALVAGRIDFAVHSYKDVPTAEASGLMIAAVPGREAAHDVLVTRTPAELDRLPDGFRLGTSSPRRAAQFRRVAHVEVVPIRGNVETRIAKIEREGLDGVVLAAAGLKRLGLDPPNRIDLPTDRFLPAPAQGALAVQARVESTAARLIQPLDDRAVRRAVEAERSFLHAVGAGCHVPLGALAAADENGVSLRGQLFSEDGGRVAEGVEAGDDPTHVGRRLGERLTRELMG